MKSVDLKNGESYLVGSDLITEDFKSRECSTVAKEEVRET